MAEGPCESSYTTFSHRVHLSKCPISFYNKPRKNFSVTTKAVLTLDCENRFFLFYKLNLILWEEICQSLFILWLPQICTDDKQYQRYADTYNYLMQSHDFKA